MTLEQLYSQLLNHNYYVKTFQQQKTKQQHKTKQQQKVYIRKKVQQGQCQQNQQKIKQLEQQKIKYQDIPIPEKLAEIQEDSKQRQNTLISDQIEPQCIYYYDYQFIKDEQNLFLSNKKTISLVYRKFQIQYKSDVIIPDIYKDNKYIKNKNEFKVLVTKQICELNTIFEQNVLYSIIAWLIVQKRLYLIKNIQFAFMKLINNKPSNCLCLVNIDTFGVKQECWSKGPVVGIPYIGDSILFPNIKKIKQSQDMTFRIFINEKKLIQQLQTIYQYLNKQ